MSNHQVNLTQQENSLIDETRPAALARLDEEALKELQSRLRKARDKHFSLLRRKGAARVEAEGARGAAQPANERSGEKVEIFDEALERAREIEGKDAAAVAKARVEMTRRQQESGSQRRGGRRH